MFGHFAGPFGTGIRNAPIPITALKFISEEVKKSYERYECRESVASIEETLRRVEGNVHVSTGDLALAIGMKLYQNQNCIQTWAEFGTVNLVELLNSVRNRILDFALAVWKESPNAGETGSGTPTNLEPKKVTQDIAELRIALESDPAPSTPEKFGPKVSSWVGKMVGKAAQGSWNIGVGAAGDLLAQAIAKYYGLL